MEAFLYTALDLTRLLDGRWKGRGEGGGRLIFVVLFLLCFVSFFFFFFFFLFFCCCCCCFFLWGGGGAFLHGRAGSLSDNLKGVGSSI